MSSIGDRERSGPSPARLAVIDDDHLGLRPLTARSVIASTLLGTRPPVLPGRVLVAAAGLFGVTDSAARTALSRMVAAGELVADDGSYRLAGELLGRQEGQESGRIAARKPWDGAWWLVVTPTGRRTPADRARLRGRLHDSRLTEVREGVWARPDNIERPTLPADLLVGRFEPHGEQLGVAGWDLEDWQARAHGLTQRVTALSPGLEAGDMDLLAPGFVVSAAVLRLFRRDPLLPDELLPEEWPGPALRGAYDRFDDAYRSLLRAWFRSAGP